MLFPSLPCPQIVPHTGLLRIPAFSLRVPRLSIMYACAGEKANWMFWSLVMAALHLKPVVVFLALFGLFSYF